jgi:multidrug transporter EmrE-like cation transporter
MALEVPPPEALPESIQAASSAEAGRIVSLALLLISVFFAVGGQLTLKTAMDSVGRIGKTSQVGETLLRAMKEPLLWLGLALFGISALFWLIVLSRVRLSVAYPVVGISYILIVLLARFRLNEHVPTLRWIGVSVIALGIAIIGLSFRSKSGA